MLPRVSRTFAINIRLLRGALGEAVRVGYLLCRIADTLEDAWPGSAPEIGGRFDRLSMALDGDRGAAAGLARDAAAALASGAVTPAPGRGGGAPAEFELLAGLPRVLAAFETLPAHDRECVAECVRTLSSGMRRYATRSAARSAGAPYLDDESELHDYCWIVAGCVGVMLTRLFAARAPADAAHEAHRLALAPVVGEALQLTNILLDWPADIRRGRCHVPGAWLGEWALAPRDLVTSGRAGVAELAARLEALARAALARVPDYLDLIPARHVRYRLFCLWPALWAAGSLRHARRDPEFPWGPRRPRLPRREIWGAALGSLLVAHDPRATRRLVLAEA
ncbi:MAG TPA: squalene/phytoene synthase family protein [Candidatus Eisenbacteria bacterium]